LGHDQGLARDARQVHWQPAGQGAQEHPNSDPDPLPNPNPNPKPRPKPKLPLTLTPYLIKVRKSTWKERAEDGKDMSWMGSSLAVNHKDKGLGSHVKKRAPKKKKGMPW